MKRGIVLLGVGAITATYLSLTSVADITNSAHNFSLAAWADGEICLPCHAPHNAIEPGAGPLWNHTVTTASYQIYGGDGSFLPTAEALDEISILCMSCHDGTVAVDAFGGSAGTFTMVGPANVGTDLRANHPVGVTGEYPTHAGFNDPSTWENTAGFGFALKEMDIAGTPTQVVSCGTCHEPHNRNSIPNLLWVDNSGSQLCLTCHNK